MREPGPICNSTYFLSPFVASTFTFTCFGFDSARFGICTVSTPFLYSALMASVLIGIRQTEAAAEGAVGALDAQVIVLVHLLLELALAADGERVVLDAHVNVLFLDARQIGFQHQLVFGLLNVHGGGPSRQIGLGAPAREGRDQTSG